MCAVLSRAVTLQRATYELLAANEIAKLMPKHLGVS